MTYEHKLINEKRSFTEYTISSPTQSFAIGFELYEDEQNIHVTLNNTPIEDLGYTFAVINSLTVEVTPAIPSGVLRIQRETDIDENKHKFSAGAIFNALSMDENFEQIRQSQQEVRDGFGNLVERVVPLVDGLEEALEQASVASQAAQDAATAAEEAAQVTRSASQVIDSSGLTQQELNNIVSSEGVNILSVYGGVDDFGAAIELAYSKALLSNCRKIIIPDGNYSAKTTANLTLVSNFTIQFSGATVINADNPIDIFDIDQDQFGLYVLGFGASVYPNWVGTSTTSVFKLDSRTLGKSLYMLDFNVYESSNRRFNFGINSTGLNYSTILDCVFQAEYPIHNASAMSGTTHSMGSEVINCKLHATNTAVTLVNNGALGCEGWKFSGGEYFGKTGLSVIDNTTDAAYYPPFLLVDGVHMNAQRFFSLSGISRVKIANCDLQSQVTANSEFKGLIEFDGVQVLDIDATTAISQANTTGSAPVDSLPVYYLRNSTRSKVSAFLNLGILNYWLVQSAPLIKFDTSVLLSGRVLLPNINTNAFTGVIVQPSDAHLVYVSKDSRLTNQQLGTGLSISTDAIYDSSTGVLTLGKAPTFGDFFQLPTTVVPDNAVINQIKSSDVIGRVFYIALDASNVTLNHSVSLYTPVGVQNTLNYGATLTVLSYNSDLCRVIGVTPNASVLTASIPVSTQSSGIHGQRVFSGGFIYEYFKGIGWVRYAATTF